MIAVALFGDEISPRFDCCAELAFIPAGEEFEAANRILLKGSDSEDRILRLLEQPCRALLCGGIRKQDRLRLIVGGVEVVDGLSGPAIMRIEEFRKGGLKV